MRIGIDRTLRVLQIVFLATVMVMLLTAAGLQLRGSAKTTFVLDYDNTSGGQDQYLYFNRGSTGDDAYLKWDETNDIHSLSHPLQAIPRAILHGTSTLTNGAAGGKTVSYMDDSPSAEWTDSESAARVVMSDDGTLFKMGSNSLKMAFDATATTEDGAAYVTGQPYNFTDNESIGFWAYSTVALSGADFAYELQDDGGEQVINFPAVAATTWAWVSLTLPGANADKDVISEQRIVQKVDKGEFDLYIDAVWKWDDDQQITLAQQVLTEGVTSIIEDATGGVVGNWTTMVEYTNYFVDYGGTDYVVVITDESASRWIINYAY